MAGARAHLYLSRNNGQESSEEIIADEGAAQLLTRKCLSHYYPALSRRGDSEKQRGLVGMKFI